MDMIKILGLLKGFVFVMVNILEAFFRNGYTKLIKVYFSHTGCPKNENLDILVEKRDIWT